MEVIYVYLLPIHIYLPIFLQEKQEEMSKEQFHSRY